MPWTEGALGAVVAHGFTGAPSNVWPVARALATAGITARVPLLSGHGGGVAGVAASTANEWRADFRDAAREVYAVTKRPVFLAGLSMGALLAMDAVQDPNFEVPVAGLAVMSPPLLRGGMGRPVSAWVDRTPMASGLIFPKLGGPDIANKAPIPSMAGMPFKAVHQLFTLIDDVKGRLELLDCPLLLIHARNDHTAPLEGTFAIANAATGKPLKLVVLQRSYHVITRDLESTRVASEVAAFARRLVSPPSAHVAPQASADIA